MVPQPSVHNSPGEIDFPAALSLLSTEVTGGKQKHTGQMISGAAGTGVFWLPFALGSYVASQLSVHRPCQTRVGLPGIYRHSLTGPQEGHAPARDSKTN